jgi:hypothetical protein
MSARVSVAEEAVARARADIHSGRVAVAIDRGENRVFDGADGISFGSGERVPSFLRSSIGAAGFGVRKRSDIKGFRNFTRRRRR